MKFWIDKDDKIQVGQLLKAAGFFEKYAEIRNIIKDGRVTVNYETVLKPRFPVKVGDEVRFEDHHIKILANKDINRKHKPEPQKTGVRHGKTKSWESKPLKPQIKIEQQIKNAVLQLQEKLIHKQKTIAIAESCTGGIIQGYLTANSGASKFYKGGIVAYSDEIKENVLQISSLVLEKFKAVSAETAKAMAENTKNIFSVEIAGAVTGIAGPTGGTKEKPVGTVYIAAASEDRTLHKKLNLQGNREKIRLQACLELIKFLWENF
ncbi:MAG: nicotinamide-nucleotide amidohydrolase family protein [Candidatus Cloacimonadota bacterium]|nr:nicotinamide-nucleotide amidohydrolase family protein [Candidatus Cloacimonadota bacterium]